MTKHSNGTLVQWKWSGGTAVGKVKESFTSEVTRTIKGSEITRKATSEEPAYLVETEKGDTALKSHSELSKAGKAGLLKLAKDKEVEGRSKMTIAQLEKAVF